MHIFVCPQWSIDVDKVYQMKIVLIDYQSLR